MLRASILVGSAAVFSHASYCLPNDPCWPTPASWAALNVTVGGRLLVVRPLGEPCYTEGLDSAACVGILGNWTNASWRSWHPGAMQDPNWEENSSGQACFSPWTGSCEQGDVPPMAVAAETPAHVAAAVSFALKFNIRVAIKSSGHDQMGRSTAPGALLVWMRRVSCISIDDSYAACPSIAPSPAITTCPGDDWGSTYEAAGARGFDVVGGSARSVSSSGGYTLGGGHSWMSPFYGLAVDNVLSFTAVREAPSCASVLPIRPSLVFRFCPTARRSPRRPARMPTYSGRCAGLAAVLSRFSHLQRTGCTLSPRAVSQVWRLLSASAPPGLLLCSSLHSWRCEGHSLEIVNRGRNPALTHRGLVSLLLLTCSSWFHWLFLLQEQLE